MSTTEIIAQLPQLTAVERDAIRAQLDALESALPVSAEEKRLIDARVAAYRQNPGATVSWAVAEDEIRKQAGL
ncbi:MAG: addiction module protein [Verrucomicrobia bacterium]|nr:addiction module protein [Verrucomicrobiota bacterium]